MTLSSLLTTILPDKMASCRHDNCAVLSNYRSFASHEGALCRWRIVPCLNRRFCDFVGPAGGMLSHSFECETIRQHSHFYAPSPARGVEEDITISIFDFNQVKKSCFFF